MQSPLEQELKLYLRRANEGVYAPPGQFASLSKQKSYKFGSSYLYENKQDS